MRRACLAILLLSAFAVSCEDTAPTAQGAAGGAGPCGPLKAGLALYDQEQQGLAIEPLTNALATPSCGEADRQKAQFFLGKSYFVVKDYDRSLATLDAIAAQPDHPYRSATFKWLVSLFMNMGPARVCPSLKRYEPDDFDQPAIENVRDKVKTACGV